jgi:hypothetical protein
VQIEKNQVLMKPLNFKSLLPHFAAIGIFVLIALVFCKPALEGKVLQQSDIIHWKGMSKDIADYKEINGKTPLWTNSMFSGMPGYQIATDNNNVLPYYANEAFSLFIPKPFRFFILAAFGFYFLGFAFGVNPWISIIGAIGYAYASYSSIIVVVGHDTKMLTMAYVPALLGAIILVYKEKYWIGALLTAIFSSVLISHNHYQIVYYFLILAIVLGVALLVDAIRKKEISNFFKPTLIVIAAGCIGLFTNAVMLFTTYDYSKATIRGGQSSINTKDTTRQEANKGGLDTAYAFAWSYGIGETMTLMVPNVYGGASQLLGEDAKLIQTLNDKGVPQQLGNQLYGAFPAYWGPQPSTSGPVYLGAVLCFLFIMGMLLIKGPYKWWILGATILAIMMSWGKNLAGFNTFLFDHLPMYNKFRAPSMTLVIPQMTIPLMAILALNKIFSGELSKEELLKKLKLSAYITAGILAIAVFMYTSLEYKTSNDRAIQQQLSTMAQGDPSFGSDIVNAVAEDRKKLFGDDLTRTALLVAIAFMLIYLYNKGLFNKTAAIASLVALTAFDMLGVSSRYLNADKFLEPEEYESSFATTPADQQILQDKGNHFRVFNLTQDVFNDAITSYHHRSIGGYHAAKLSIYQDLIENQLAKQPLNLQVLNMLDTKYIITTDSTGNPYPSVNPEALGAAWLVNNIVWAKDAKAEMMALDTFNAKTTAVVQESFKSIVNEKIAVDSVAYVKLIQPGHDTLKYESNSSSATFAVFSEVYYDKGWLAFVDGKEQPIIKTNYALRGLSLSPGKHEIEFRFVPASYYSGYNITKYSQLMLVLFFIATIGVNFWNKKKKTT